METVLLLFSRYCVKPFRSKIVNNIAAAATAAVAIDVVRSRSMRV